MKDPRVLVDSSAIIALASIGELDILRDIFTEIPVTSVICEEILVEDYPETDEIGEAVEEWMEVVEVDESDLQKYERYGLGKGESSLIEVSRKNGRLVLDDPVARRVAEVEGLDFTGLIGLLVESCRVSRVSRDRGREILDKLSGSDFRMTAELYSWAMRRLEK
ncbi:hypothetical protein AKJ57_01840 [candidate division MSBL1 archaeon SCGC-AAA259A05]|uniref:PIN domain-containing protein n=1 Tax=candidate division MSBL1 archaeon SCGC-AAA259A05 TaxID=1698259 RepID=A0A133UAS0_9EURY|nr:hypothetical protein AKJ57_01840 [candidate division MSBL1 archaeon SCGC-AAA259A05]